MIVNNQLPEEWLETFDSWVKKKEIGQGERTSYPRIMEFAEDYKNVKAGYTVSNPFKVTDNEKREKTFLSLSLDEIFDIWKNKTKEVIKFISIKNKSYSAVFRRYICLLKIYEICKQKGISVNIEEKKEELKGLVESLYSESQGKNSEPDVIKDKIEAWSCKEPLQNLMPRKYDLKDYPHQIIFYGAPGNGKSNAIKSFLVRNNIRHKRCTFHPEMDYASFVGAYMPCSNIQTKGQDDASDEEENDFDIKYEYRPQIFIDTYMEAMQHPDKEIVLVIEEINRGNCAQIFGDIFQLLDRVDEGEDKGKSVYPIIPDHFLDGWLYKKLNKNYQGELRLPSNLYIWATMNVSDQSLFPIDSAFFRRWIMRYVPVGKGDEKLMIGDTGYSWNQVQTHINSMMDYYGIPDKKLGKFFLRAQNGSISEEDFVGKVVFYLYKYIFPVYSIHEDLMKDFPFDEFYVEEVDCELLVEKNTNIVKKKVKNFLDKLIEPKKIDGSLGSK